MDEVVYPACALLAAAGLIYKLPECLRHRDSAHWALIGLLTCMTVVFTLDTPVVYVAFDGLVGVPNLAKLFVHGGTVSLCLWWQTMLAHWVYPQPQARRRVLLWAAGYLLTAATMTALFLRAPVHHEETTEFTAVYGGAPYIAEYTAVYLIYAGLTLADIIRLSLRFANITDRPFLRRGLRLQAYGACFGVAYLVEKAAYVASSSAHHPWLALDVQENLSPILGGPGGVLVLLGLTLPSFGPKLATVLRYRQLRPLWRLLYEATPEIALTSPSAIGWNLQFRLVRRITEIRDGQLALRAWLSQSVAEAARQAARDADKSGDKLEAVVEAAVLLDAVRAKSKGQRPAVPYAAPTHGSADIAVEMTWLIAVARALQSPVVRDVVATTRVTQLPDQDVPA